MRIHQFRIGLSCIDGCGYLDPKRSIGSEWVIIYLQGRLQPPNTILPDNLGLIMAGNVREMKFWITLLFLQGLVCVSTQHGVVRPTQAPVFELVEALDHPVIGVSEGKSMHGINHGFEGSYYLP